MIHSKIAQDEFTKVRNIQLSHCLYKSCEKTLVGYLLIAEYQSSTMRTLDEIIFDKLSSDSIKELIREIIEINLNLTSMAADIEKVSRQSLVIVKEKDVKVDLFYISLFAEIQILHSVNSPDASFLAK
jgi:hypothetical protein